MYLNGFRDPSKCIARTTLTLVMSQVERPFEVEMFESSGLSDDTFGDSASGGGFGEVKPHRFEHLKQRPQRWHFYASDAGLGEVKPRRFEHYASDVGDTGGERC